MRDSFRPNVRLATNILMVVGTFLIAFNLSKISTRSRDSQIKEDCIRVYADAITKEEFVKKYKLEKSLEKKSLYKTFEIFCSVYLGK